MLLKVLDGVAAQFVHPLQRQLDQNARVVGLDRVRADVQGGGDFRGARPLTRSTWASKRAAGRFPAA